LAGSLFRQALVESPNQAAEATWLKRGGDVLQMLGKLLPRREVTSEAVMAR
jgi:hypothetical protein